MFLIQVKFSCRRDKKVFLSEFIFLDLRTNFSNQENISQYVLRDLQCIYWTDGYAEDGEPEMV